MDRIAQLDILEQRIKALFAVVRPSLSAPRAENVRSFIEATEYGLAFEEITGSLVEADVRLTADALRLAEDAAAVLGKQNDTYLQNLRDRIAGSAPVGPSSE